MTTRKLLRESDFRCVESPGPNGTSATFDAVVDGQTFIIERMGEGFGCVYRALVNGHALRMERPTAFVSERRFTTFAGVVAALRKWLRESEGAASETPEDTYARDGGRH